MSDLVPPPARSGKRLMERLEDALLPLINLVFLLLMFFIVAGQLSDTPLPDLPGTGSGAGNEQPHADLVVTAAGDWQVGGQTVGSGGLANVLPAPAKESPLKIAAEQDIAMANLEALLRVLEDSGYEEIILLTEPAS
ncbi:ExbD/TolR family protein [Marinobacter orientalis]|uniref:Biopolymer transporter ExbD n=1 Tax=Marinobacter orientalis TaxID=1928859 RepID=A0A7Y0RAH9_9GAMM|nr:biopolymer transporter ExbD [Marinobacter orientalis]NMT62924.1 biopolymer transporter ExbD [Marinobacter orientalis]TGX51594.1 biopolymer transporter ExbD [Marinobacter orientalis]